LQSAGIGAHRIVEDAWELMDSEWAKQHGLSVTREHDDLGPVTTVGPSPRLSRTPPEPGKPAPRPGSDARHVLAAIGRADDIDRLIAAGVVVTEGVVAG
jgi:crotonobetainyl-CoA:carnitine CoA-transferase CaiB-like acyl-CoA transferase